MDAVVERELARLQDAVGQTGATLLALERDATVQLLDASTLSGETAARWAEVATARAALFRAHHELSDLIDRASASRRAREVGELLRGPSVVLADVTRPLAERGLLDGSRRVERGTPDQLLAEMAAVFVDVRAVIAAVEATWADAIPWIRACRERLDGLGTCAAGLDTPIPSVLDGLVNELATLAEEVLSNPLAWSPSAAAGIESRLAHAADELTALQSVRDDWTGELARAEQILEALGDEVDRADQVAAKTISRIVGATPSTADDPAVALAAELDAIARAAGSASWIDLATGLADWRRRAEDRLAATTATAAQHRALLGERDELRGRLDAYEAKAARLGRLEDPELSELHRKAHDVLHTAPTDLAEAGALVERYCDALRGGGTR
jgi:hypothetical protein